MSLTFLLAALICWGGVDDAAAPSSSPATTPYRIELWLDFEDHPRFPPEYRTAVADELRKLAHRLMGEAWQLEIRQSPPGTSFENPPPAAELAESKSRLDKILWLNVAAGHHRLDYGRSTVPVRAREHDAELAEWTPILTIDVSPGPTLARSLFEAAYRQFRPIVEFTGRATSKTIDATIFGQALLPINGPMKLVEPGTPFRIFREMTTKESEIVRSEIPWSYLIYRGPDRYGEQSKFDIVSGLRNPLALRSRRKSRVLGLACTESPDATTTIRFVAGQENRPIVGFEVVAKPQDQSAEVSIGNTDYEGRITIRPIQLSTERTRPTHPRILEVSLLAGRSILARFPLVPGINEELTVRARLDPLLTDLSGQVLALQDEVVDVVARRALLQRELERHAEKQNLDQAKRVADTMNGLPGKVEFEEKLEAIKQNTEERARVAKRTNLGPAINRMFMQTELLIQRYFQTDKVEIELAEEKAPANSENADAPAEEEAAPSDAAP